MQVWQLFSQRLWRNSAFRFGVLVLGVLLLLAALAPVLGTVDPAAMDSAHINTAAGVRGEFAQLDLSWREGGKGYAEYKKRLLEYFHARFDAARQRREELRRDPAEVERILVDGARRAREMAAPIMERIRRATGIR